MSLITKEEALEVLEPYFPLFRRAINAAWKAWITGPVAPRMQHKRVRANVVWNDYFFEMISEISNEKYKGIRFAKIPYNQGFVVDGRYFIKFKKADSNFLSSNLPTQSALKYHDPEIDMFGGEVRLELIYVLDKDGISINEIAIIQRKDKFVAWAINVSGENVVEIGGIQDDMSNITSESVAKKVIKPRKKAKKELVDKDGTNQ